MGDNIFHSTSHQKLTFKNDPYRINIGDSIETVRIGGGVYPTMALVNHSCDPNFVIVFWGRVAVAVASRLVFTNIFGKAFLFRSRSEKGRTVDFCSMHVFLCIVLHCIGASVRT